MSTNDLLFRSLIIVICVVILLVFGIDKIISGAAFFVLGWVGYPLAQALLRRVRRGRSSAA